MKNFFIILIVLLSGCNNSTHNFRSSFVRRNNYVRSNYVTREYAEDFSSVIRENTAQKHADKMANEGNISFSGIVKYGPIYEFVCYSDTEENVSKMQPNPAVFSSYPNLLDKGVAYSENRGVWFACTRYAQKEKP